MKLNIGCGNDIQKGYINVDVRPTGDIIANVMELPFKSNSITEIRAIDIYEHIPFKNSKKLLKEWHRVLKKKGKLYIQTTSLNHLAKYVLNCKNPKKIENAILRIFGGQTYTENTHFTSGHPILFKKYLSELGFKNIKIKSGNFGNGTNMRVIAIKEL
jgi:ubiquinone/menaquinone biosynthesis C-methylase UbiE